VTYTPRRPSGEGMKKDQDQKILTMRGMKDFIYDQELLKLTINILF
jgi:hypothetical protein